MIAGDECKDRHSRMGGYMEAAFYRRFVVSAHCRPANRLVYQTDLEACKGLSDRLAQDHLFRARLQEAMASGEVLPLHTERKGNDAKRILVLEPHSDDGIFSAGGYLLNAYRSGGVLHSLCVFSKGGDLERTRHRENQVVWEDALGATVCFAQLLDAPYRQDAQAPVMLYRKTYRAVLSAISKAMEWFSPEVVLAPLGIGDHVDHQLVNAAARFLSSTHTEIAFLYYEDYPYCMNACVSSGQIAASCKTHQPLYFDITAVFHDKVTLQHSYQSQHEYSKSQVEEYAFNYAKSVAEDACEKNSHALYERFWAVP